MTNNTAPTRKDFIVIIFSVTSSRWKQLRINPKCLNHSIYTLRTLKTFLKSQQKFIKNLQAFHHRIFLKTVVVYLVLIVRSIDNK